MIMLRREFIALVGSVVAWPCTIDAQQPSTPIVGFMSSRAAEESAHLVAAFHQGLQELGFIEGQNVIIEYRWARGDHTLPPVLAAELVARRVNVLVTSRRKIARHGGIARISQLAEICKIGQDYI